MLCCRNLLSKNVRLLTKFHKQHCRNLLIGTVKFEKRFQENENEHAFAVLDHRYNLQALLKPVHLYPSALGHVNNSSSSTLNGLLDLANVPIEELHNRFVLITTLIKGDSEVTIEEPRFNELVENIVKALPLMTFDQIACILAALKDWPSTGAVKSPNFYALWKALDYLCTSHCDEWTHEQHLKIAYLWFHLRVSRMTSYNSKMIHILANQINNLSMHMVVQLLFFINLQRIQIPEHLAAKIERRLLENLESLTLDELGVAALGFFKTQTPLKSENLITAIIAKILIHVNEIDEKTLAAILKQIRHSSTFNVLPQCRELQSAFVSRVDNLHTATLTHLILLVAHHLVCHNELLMKVTLKFSRDIRLARLKEISKSLYCTSMYNSSSLHHNINVDYGNKVVDELRLPERQKEIEEYPASFISMILSLAYMNIFPEDLINICLGKELFNISKNSKIDVTRELTVIDQSVRIECPWYKGNRLQSSVAERIFKKHRSKSSKITHHDKMIHDIYENMIDVFGISEDNLQICHILPHFQMSDILFIMDENDRIKVIPDEARSVHWNGIPTNTKDKWFAVIGAGRACYQRDHRMLTGAYEMKLRQLKKLGYTVVVVVLLNFYDSSEPAVSNTSQQRQYHYWYHGLFTLVFQET